MLPERMATYFRPPHLPVLASRFMDRTQAVSNISVLVVLHNDCYYTYCRVYITVLLLYYTVLLYVLYCTTVCTTVDKGSCSGIITVRAT